MENSYSSNSNSKITLDSVLENCPRNSIIVDNLIRAFTKVNSPIYQSIICSISGGSDSDIVLDICTKVDKQKKIHYVWFDTGLEYQATKNHLKYLEEKYDINIESFKAIKPIPVSCKEYGQPFLSKYVSDMILRLQRHGFKWEDKPFNELYEEYPKCKTALQWWTNTNQSLNFNIKKNRWLKEFMVINHPLLKFLMYVANTLKKIWFTKLLIIITQTLKLLE